MNAQISSDPRDRTPRPEHEPHATVHQLPGVPPSSRHPPTVSSHQDKILAHKPPSNPARLSGLTRGTANAAVGDKAWLPQIDQSDGMSRLSVPSQPVGESIVLQPNLRAAKAVHTRLTPARFCTDEVRDGSTTLRSSAGCDVDRSPAGGEKTAPPIRHGDDAMDPGRRDRRL